MCHLCQAKNYAIFQQKYQNDGLLRHICDTAPLTCWRTACLKRQTVQDSMLISMYFLQLHLALSTNWRWSHLILPPSNWLWWQITEKKTNMSSHICPLFFAMALRVVKTLNCTFLPLQDNLSPTVRHLELRTEIMRQRVGILREMWKELRWTVKCVRVYVYVHGREQLQRLWFPSYWCTPLHREQEGLQLAFPHSGAHPI